jgi:hypothetical protein
MFKCCKCEEVFEERELIPYEYHLSDYGETPVYDTEYVCPHCGCSEHYEVERCEVCGDWCATEADACGEKHIVGSVCDACLKETSVDDAFKVGEIEGKQSVQINAFLSFAFSPADIEAILLAALRKDAGTSVAEYVESDAVWFEEQLEKVRI